MSARTFAAVLGWLFLIIGILGFVPGLTDEPGMLFGIFKVDAAHNTVHLLAGLAGILLAKRQARLYLRIFGLTYLMVTLIGFVQKDTVLGLFDVNHADNWLHLFTALPALWFGFRKDGRRLQ